MNSYPNSVGAIGWSKPIKTNSSCLVVSVAPLQKASISTILGSSISTLTVGLKSKPQALSHNQDPTIPFTTIQSTTKSCYSGEDHKTKHDSIQFAS